MPEGDNQSQEDEKELINIRNIEQNALTLKENEDGTCTAIKD